MYFDTVACETVKPSFSNSPWILGAPHSGFARLIRRIRSRSPVLILGRPATCSECRQLVHSFDRKTQKIRSISVSRGRGSRAFHTASCCRSARFSSASSQCVRRKTASQCPNEDSEPSDHDREIADQSAECKFIAPDDFLEGQLGRWA